MKKILVLALGVAITLAACNKSKETSTGEIAQAADVQAAALDSSQYILRGAPFTGEGIEDAAVLPEKLKKGGVVPVKVEGEITGSCQKRGCWASIKITGNQDATVKFKDYAFFVPVEDLTGKKLLINGEARLDTTTVEQLRKDAKEDGQTPKEIAAITQPEITYMIEASGIALKK